jgi:hypothetical protein
MGRLARDWRAVQASSSVGDPNWFYSTLAQSSAAIVGLAGGFMVSRVLARAGASRVTLLVFFALLALAFLLYLANEVRRLGNALHLDREFW